MTRVVLAMMKHETNTFSPVPTDLARFSKGAERPLDGGRNPRRLPGHGVVYGRVHRRGGGGGSGDRALHRRECAPERSGAHGRLRVHLRRDPRGSGGRVRRNPARPPRSDGDRAARGWGRGAARAHPGDRAGRPDRGDPRHARQPLPRDGGQRRRHRRLPDLSPHRLSRDRGARGAADLRDAAGRGAAGRGVGKPADAAPRHAAGKRRLPEPRAPGAGAGNGGGRRHRGKPLHRVPACRHRQRGARLRGGDGRRPGGGGGDARRAPRLRMVQPRGVRLPDRAARGLRSHAPGGRRPTPGLRPHAIPPLAATARWSCSTTTTMRPPAARWTR